MIIRKIFLALTIYLISLPVFAKEYPIVYIDPHYKYEAMDPNHHWAPKLNEVYENEYFKDYHDSSFFEWVSENRNLPKTIYIDMNSLPDYEQEFISPNIAVNKETKKRHKKGIEMYVMDYNGNFFMHKKIRPKVDQVGFNHSSLFNAGPISSVGFLHFNDVGEIIAIDNYSGHYKPSDAQIVSALHALQDKGIDLSKIDLYRRISPETTDKDIFNAEKWYIEHKNLLGSPKLPDTIIADLHQSISKHELKGALMVGGGIAYQSKNYIKGKANDIDAMFVFESRKEMEDFILDNTKDSIMEKFLYEDLAYFDKEEIDIFIENKIEVMRISGKIKGLKVTIKLVDAESLQNAGTDTFFQVMSKGKDKRIFYGISLKGNPITIMIINQSYPEEDDLTTYVILDKNYYKHEDTYVPGLITDFMITAKPMKYYKGVSSKLQYTMRKQFVNILTKKGCLPEGQQITSFFVREDRFSDAFKDDLNETLTKMQETVGAPLKVCEKEPIPGYVVEVNPDMFIKPFANFSYSKPTKPESMPIFPPTSEERYELIVNAVHKIDGNMSVPSVESLSEESKIFTSNDYAGKIFLGQIDGNDAKSQSYFYKFMRAQDPYSVSNEIESLKNIKQIYKNIVVPKYEDPLYRFFISPWVDGTQLLELLTSSFSESKNVIFKAELLRAEATINAYVASMASVQSINSTDQPIRKLYFDRLVGPRLDNYYKGKDLNLPGGESIYFDELLGYTPVINSVEYAPLSVILDEAKKYLEPKLLNSLVKVYGFADDHGGNVLIKPNGEYATIDYEYASISHPAQDISKSLYNDIYTSFLFGNTNVEYLKGFSIDHNAKKIYINHDFSLSPDKKALLDVKLKGVMETTKYVAKANGHNLESWDQVFNYSLFVAGFLNKNLSTFSPEQTVLSFAILIQIATDGPTLEKD